ncbi:MAG TPA: hypothetical protein VMM80_03435 [Bacteroidota bacterium]|nr:hypothetical protein [Bacteroidota bacterium]
MIARTFLLAAVLTLAGRPENPAGSSIEGTWKFVPAKSTEIATWKGRIPEMVIFGRESQVCVIENWLERGQVAYADTFLFTPGGPSTRSLVRSVEWPDNWFMGVLSSAGDERSVSGSWQTKGSDLRVITVQPVVTSQGKTSITTTREFALGSDGLSLTVTERRSSRPAPVVLVFERKEGKP